MRSNNIDIWFHPLRYTESSNMMHHKVALNSWLGEKVDRKTPLIYTTSLYSASFYYC